MMPYSEINIGDCFSNPMHRGYGKYSGLEWVVIDKKENLVKVQAISYASLKYVGEPIWKKPSDRMFSEYWKILTIRPKGEE